MCWLGAALEQEDNYELQTPEKCRIARLMVAKNSRQQVKRCLKSFLQWHIFTTFLLWINVRVKRSLGRHWGDWYWFMAACEPLRRSGPGPGAASSASRSSANVGRCSGGWPSLAWAQITMIYVEAGLWLTAANPWPASLRWWEETWRPDQAELFVPPRLPEPQCEPHPACYAERQTKRMVITL